VGLGIKALDAISAAEYRGRYSKRIMALIQLAQEASSLASLDAIWRDLLAILT
jgi:hypothetical protein